MIVSPPAPPLSPNRPSPAAARRRRRLLRLQQEMRTLHEQLTAIREATAQLAAVEATRSFTSGERRRVAQLKLQAEGVRLELQRLREAVAETLQMGRAGDT
jgi:hypothetical protein